MFDWLGSLRDVVNSSLDSSQMPFPFDSSICYKWREGLEFGRSKERILYTSCMYPLGPIIRSAVDKLEGFSATGGGIRGRLAALGAKAFGGLLLKPSREEVDRAANVLRSIYRVLRASGVEFGVLDEEPYSGALLYELGLVDDFAAYARRVHESLKSNGVREIITTDPHTQYVLEMAYPRYVQGFDIKVTSYLDLIDRSKVRAKPGDYVVHDSCIYARNLAKSKYGTVRELLSGAHLVEDPAITGKDASQCCGGPIESTYPSLAKAVAANRVRNLSKLSSRVIVECPICYANLKRASEEAGIPLEFHDLSEVLEVA
jgi:Fe-S oxidoreductase